MVRRNTVQQKIVSEAVNELKNHASADEIYEYVSKKYPSIGRATVYRVLQRLSDDGKIKKIEVPKGAERFDHNCSNHYHIKCKICGGIFDVDMPHLSDLESNIKNKNGFIVTDHNIIFTGICPDCQKK